MTSVVVVVVVVVVIGLSVRARCVATYTTALRKVLSSLFCVKLTTRTFFFICLSEEKISKLQKNPRKEGKNFFSSIFHIFFFSFWFFSVFERRNDFCPRKT